MKTKPLPVTFQDPNDIEVVILAQLGRGTTYIQESTGLTPHQIAYRLAKAKKAEGYQPGHTYRSEWRAGTGAMAQMVETLIAPKVRPQVKQRLQPLFKREEA